MIQIFAEKIKLFHLTQSNKLATNNINAYNKQIFSLKMETFDDIY